MSRITASARGEDCEIRLPGVCTFDPAQTVWCHSNGYAAGKGKSLKAKDYLGAYGCYACHMVYDGQRKRPEGMSRQDVELAFADAMRRSLIKLEQKGLIEVA